MAALADRGFIGATPLTEALCQERGLAFRVAKTVVERAVALSVAAGSADRVSYEALMQALAEAELPIDVSSDDVRAWQSPELVLSRLTHAGSPGPEAVLAAAEALTSRLGRCQV